MEKELGHESVSPFCFVYATAAKGPFSLAGLASFFRTLVTDAMLPSTPGPLVAQ
jgi:hypothetical protein